MKNTAKRRPGQSHFSFVPGVNIRRSIFDRSHGYKTAFNEGQLVPFFCDEVLPGDTFKLKTAIFGRLSTPVVPFMDNLNLEVRFFFVPNRLIWDNWERFCGAQDDPDDSTEYAIPSFTTSAGGVTTGSLADYLGVPIGVAGLSVNTLPFRAYQLIWNTWYRDENLQDSIVIQTGDSGDSFTSTSLAKVTKYHDYFTSALPWPQKGTSLSLPLGATAPVTISGKPGGTAYGASLLRYYSAGSDAELYSYPTSSYTSAQNGRLMGLNSTAQNEDVLFIGGTPEASTLTKSTGGHYLGVRGQDIGLNLTKGTLTGVADLSSATAMNINELRIGVAAQHFLERQARGGTRYVEILQSHFGVRSPDARLQRPEYLGGFTAQMNIHSVEQTSSTDAVTPQGNLAAFGVVSKAHHGFNKSFVEHGYIIGLVNTRVPLSYQQGLPRMFSRQSLYDIYWPEFANLGEQAVLNKEIYAQGSSVVDDDGNAVDDNVFGYQERYAEYRYHPSYITGKLRSTDANSLDVWHLAQNFGSLPVLNQSFITENAPLSRVLAVQDEPQIILDCWFDLKCARPMPVYSVPGLKHF